MCGENTARFILSSWCSTIEHLISSHNSNHHALLFYLNIRRTNSFHILGFIPSLLKSFYSSSSSPFLCKTLHSDSLKLGTISDTKVATSFLTFYSSCRLLQDSHNLFYSTPFKTTPTFNAMIASYILNHHPLPALSLFSQMLSTHNPPPSPSTLLHIISSFSQSHNPSAARLFFDSTPPPLKSPLLFSAMIHCHTSNSQMRAAQHLFQSMTHKNPFVFSSMISGYFRIPLVHKAELIFRQIQNKTLVIWNSMISGYLQNGYPIKALATFSRMRREGVRGDERTVVSALSACAAMGRLDLGRQVHKMVHEEGIRMNKYTACALVDMYGKCGDLKTAERVFSRTGRSHRKKECWNAMMGAKGWHGRGGEAVEMVEKMGEDADAVSFVTVLSGCGHGGLVEEGLGEKVWGRMKRKGVGYGVEHYGCVVDMLGRGGEVGLGYELVKRLKNVGFENGVVSSSLAAAASRFHFGGGIPEFGDGCEAMTAGFSVLIPT